MDVYNFDFVPRLIQENLFNISSYYVCWEQSKPMRIQCPNALNFNKERGAYDFYWSYDDDDGDNDDDDDDWWTTHKENQFRKLNSIFSEMLKIQIHI